MAERLLLTGAGGLVGRAIVAPLLASGVELHAVSRGTPAAIPGVTWHRADLLDEGEARALLRDLRPATLLHAAWYVEHGKFWHAPENELWVEASQALAHAFAEAGGRRFLGIGTCAEYADVAAGDGAPWPESRALGGATLYGRAKAALGERLLAMPGLSVAWARLFHLFGEGEPPAKLVPDVALSLLAGREARCGSGRAVRDYASTAFLGRALAALATSGVTGPVNVASGQGRPMAEVIGTIAEIIGRPDLVRLGARPDPANEVAFMVADTTRLRREVGFTEDADLRGDLAALVRSLAGFPGRGILP
jgi:nucleoside-diphosphate-sugar epimerase